MNFKSYPWVVVGLLWMVGLLNYLDRQMLSTMQPFMRESIAELNTAANFGRLMAVFLWIYAFMSPISGLIGDRISRKWLIVGSLFVWSGVTFAMGFATSFGELYVMRAVMGVSEAFYIPAGLALIADYHKAGTRSLAVAVHSSGIYLGQALGGFGATLAAAASWQFTFQAFGVIGIVYSLVLIAFLRDAPASSTMQSPPSVKRFALNDIARSMSVLFGNIAFWVILFFFMAPGMPGWVTKNWLPTLFAGTLGLPMESAGPYATVTLAVTSFAGAMTGGRLSDRWVQKNLRGRIYTSAIGMALTIPAMLLLGFGGNAFTIFAGALCFGFGFGFYDANNMPILCQFVAPRYRATAYGLMNFAGVIAGAFITDYFGKSIDAGRSGTDFALLIGVVAIAVLLQLTVLRPKTANMEIC